MTRFKCILSAEDNPRRPATKMQTIKIAFAITMSLFAKRSVRYFNNDPPFLVILVRNLSCSSQLCG